MERMTNNRYEIRMELLHQKYPYELYLMDKKTGRSGVVGSFPSEKGARKALLTWKDELKPFGKMERMT